MTFSEWVRAHWLNRDERVTTGLMRLSGAWGVSYKTLFYAEHGARVRPEIASKIESATGGRVKAAELVMLPPRATVMGDAADEDEEGEDDHPKSMDAAPHAVGGQS